MAVLITEKQITTLLNSNEEASSSQLDESLAAAEAELRPALEAKGLGTKLELADSAMLRRFLIARRLQIPATVAMLEAHVAWREQTLPIHLSEVRSEIHKGKAYEHGVDVKGRPLVFVCSRNFDPNTRDLEQCLRAIIYMLNSALRKHDAQFAVFYDRTDFSLSKNLDIGDACGPLPCRPPPAD